MSSKLTELTASANIELSEENIVKLTRYKELVLEWNQKFNLTAITDDEEFDIKHFYDCLLLLKLDEIKGAKKIIDIGTGAGFPGIPLAIMMPDTEFLLLDSLKKRIGFLEFVIEDLGLKKVRAIHARAEELGRDPEYREKYDICISRAVASLDTLSEFCIPFVKPSGHFVSMKGSAGREELKDAKNAIEILGGKPEDIIEYELVEGDHKRFLISIKKIKSTSKKYPRAGGKPKSKPL